MPRALRYKQADATGTLSSIQAGDGPVDGTADGFANKAHQHGVDTGANTAAIAPDNVAGEGAGPDLARDTHIHAVTVTGAPNLSTINAGDAAGAGSHNSIPRGDHQHPVATGGATVSGAPDNVAGEGASANLARENHVHAYAMGSPVDVGTANAPGSANTFPRADHVHAIGAAAQAAVLESKRFGFGIQTQDFTTSAASSDSGNAITKEIFDASVTKRIGGGAGAVGVVTTASDNKGQIRDRSTNDPIETASNEQVYHRLTVATPALAGTWTWDGTTTVLATDTSGVVVGNFIFLTADGQCFEIASIIANTSVVILNPGGLTIPTGSGGSEEADITISYFFEADPATETAYTFGGATAVDLVFIEALGLNTAPFNAILGGVAFAEVLPASHLHDNLYTRLDTLTTKGDIYVRNATVVTRLGVGANGTHLEADSAEATGMKWATVATSPTRNQEVVTTEVITGTDTAMTDTLNAVPVDPASVLLTLNGLKQRQGAGNDYTLASQTITWLASTGTAVDMDTSDDMDAYYES